MNDHELDQLLRQAQPASAAKVPRVAPMLREAGQDLLEEIVSETEKISPKAQAEALEVVPLKRGRRPAPWLLAVAAAAAVVMAVTVPMLVFGREGSKGSVVPAAASVNASGNPFLILDDRRWRPDSMGQRELEGFQSFAGPGQGQLTVHWGRASIYSNLYNAQRDNFSPPSKTSSLKLLGAEATVFDRHDGNFVAMMMPEGSKVYLQFFATGVKNRTDFEEALTQLRPASEEEWTKALPEDTVLPDTAAEVAGKMLSQVDTPSGVEPSDFPAPFARGYFPYASEVAIAVYCGWALELRDARSAGDEKRENRISEAIAAGSTWPVMQKMRAIEQDDPATLGEENMTGHLRTLEQRSAEDGDLGAFISELSCD